jgi:hypothetical protein
MNSEIIERWSFCYNANCGTHPQVPLWTSTNGAWVGIAALIKIQERRLKWELLQQSDR